MIMYKLIIQNVSFQNHIQVYYVSITDALMCKYHSDVAPGKSGTNLTILYPGRWVIYLLIIFCISNLSLQSN